MSLPRFLVVLFPLASGSRRGWRSTRARSARARAVGGADGVFLAQFATWHWVA